jgi:hypothetical protein
MARRIAARIGTPVEVTTGSFDPKDPARAFASYDLVVSFLQEGPSLREAARLLPFFPLRGSPALGPSIAWWAVPEHKPILAAAAAKALSDARFDGGLAADLDATLGQGAAARWYQAVGYDGVLRAQYLDLDAAGTAWLTARRAGGGGLRVAMREGGLYAYVPKPDGTIEGFDYDLVVTLANSLGLRLDITLAKAIADFFTRDGVMPADLGKADYDFTPDLLKKVDVYANPMGVTAWREKLMRMLTIYPIRNQLAGRKGEEVRDVKALDGKRFAVIKDSVQQKTLEDFAKRNGLSLSFEYGTNEDRLYDLVRSRKADYVLDGSVVFALNIDKLGDFGLSPFFSEMQGVAWAVKKDDPGFASVLSTFLSAARESGVMPALWTKTFRMEFKPYVDAMMAAESGG